MTGTAGERRARELDGLRGIAAAGVVAFHAHPGLLFPLWSFVDLFFILSGLLITGILLRIELHSPRMLLHFWMRRILRIWPVYFLTLAAVLVFWRLYLQVHGSRPELGSVWQAFVFLQYVETYLHPAGPVHLQRLFLPLFDHSWSLAVEEQYYILWPLVLWFLKPHLRGLERLCLALFAISTLALAGGFFLQILLTRMGNLALGSLLAVLLYGRGGPEPATRLPLFAWCALGAGGSLCVPYLLDGYLQGTYRNLGEVIVYTPWAAVIAGSGLVYFGLVGLLVAGRLKWLARLLALRPLVYLGSLSYALYMVHPLVLFVLERVWVRFQIEAWWSRELMIWSVLLVVTGLSRALLENRMDRLKRHFPLHWTRAVIVPAQVS